VLLTSYWYFFSSCVIDCSWLILNVTMPLLF